MPYIPKGRRVSIDAGDWPRNVGELTYKLARCVDSYIGPSPFFQDIGEAIAALECLKLELYRRVVAPYEDDRREENGDAFIKSSQVKTL